MNFTPFHGCLHFMADWETTGIDPQHNHLWEVALTPFVFRPSQITGKLLPQLWQGNFQAFIDTSLYPQNRFGQARKQDEQWKHWAQGERAGSGYWSRFQASQSDYTSKGPVAVFQDMRNHVQALNQEYWETLTPIADEAQEPMGPLPPYIWAKPVTFEHAWLTELEKDFNMSPLFHYRNWRDVRSYIDGVVSTQDDQFGRVVEEMVLTQSRQAKHTSLDDNMSQIQLLQDVMGRAQ